jgi:hypothetical protein
MAFQEVATLKDKFETVSKGASLEIVLPRSTELNVSKILQDASPEALARLPSRRNLFFGNAIVPSTSAAKFN